MNTYFCFFKIHMNKVLLIVCTLLYSFQSTAQEEESVFEYGPKFGLVISELKGSENLKSLRSSFSAGLVSEYRLDDRYALLAELLYTRQGSTNRGNQQGSYFENRIDLNYFNLPILGKYYLKEGLAFEFGPQFGYLMSANYENKQAENSNRINVENDFEKLDLSIAAGISYKTDWGFLVGARYSLGLNDINSGADFESGNLNNAVLQLYFGYLFK